MHQVLAKHDRWQLDRSVDQKVVFSGWGQFSFFFRGHFFFLLIVEPVLKNDRDIGFPEKKRWGKSIACGEGRGRAYIALLEAMKTPSSVAG